MIVIEHFDPVALDIIGPDCSLSEGLGFSICKSVKCLYKSIEFVSSVEIISISKVIPGNLWGKHMSLIPPSIGQHAKYSKQKNQVRLQHNVIIMSILIYQNINEVTYFSTKFQIKLFVF